MKVVSQGNPHGIPEKSPLAEVRLSLGVRRERSSPDALDWSRASGGGRGSLHPSIPSETAKFSPAEEEKRWRAWGIAVPLEMASLLTSSAPYSFRMLSRSSLGRGQTPSRISRGFNPLQGSPRCCSAAVTQSQRALGDCAGTLLSFSQGFSFPSVFSCGSRGRRGAAWQRFHWHKGMIFARKHFLLFWRLWSVPFVLSSLLIFFSPTL